MEGTELDAHDHAVDCAKAWTESTGAKIEFRDGIWTVVETDTDPEMFNDIELIEEFSGEEVEVLP